MSTKRKAVVIDDLELFRNLLTEVLERRGYEVTSFATPHEYGCAKKNTCHCNSSVEKIDLLLTDNRLSPISGLELIEQLKKLNCRQLAGHRAILSGSWTHEEKTKARQLGCHTFDKPCSVATINAWLDNFERNH